MKLSQPLVLALTAVFIAGCDNIPGVPTQQSMDAEAIGYSCRVSKKAPEICIQENEDFSPAAILSGWKAADADIVNQLLDPSMSGKPLKTEPEDALASEDAMHDESEIANQEDSAAPTEAPHNPEQH